MSLFGTYHHRWAYPCIDGYHICGRVDVDEVRFGRVLTDASDRLPTHLPLERGLPPVACTSHGRVVWGQGNRFLRPVGFSIYGPPGNGGTDPEFRSIEQRADFEQYILRYKQ